MDAVRLENLSIQDALYNVQLLDHLPIFDDQPVIEGSSAPIDVRTNFDSNFQDREAFIFGCSKYIEEATRHGEFVSQRPFVQFIATFKNALLNEGFQHAATLYTWRCCTLGVPVVKSNDQPNRLEINERVATVLQPEADKLFALMSFVNGAVSKFVAEIARLSHPEKRRDFVSESYLLTLGKFLNMFIVLDELKNMKASMKNDMSTYRRAIQSLQSAQDLHLLQELSMFFATQNRIRNALKEELQAIEGYEELLADVVNICAHFFESKFYVTPDEKHMFVKVIAFSLFLIDGNGPNVNKLDQKKRLNIQRFDKIFKSQPMVPLFGDMPTYPFNFITKSPHYDASKWPLSSTESTVCPVQIVEKESVVERDGPRSAEDDREISEMALNGLQCLCEWTTSVIELITWKLAHPTNRHVNPECPADCEEDYEKATRYNFSTTEKAALVEIVALIKGIQYQLNRMESLFSGSIRRHIYAEMQEFLNITMTDPLQKAVKHKRDMIAAIINAIIDTCTDRTVFVFKPTIDNGEKKKKDKKDRSASLADVRIKRRSVPPSYTQLYLARTMLESLVSEKGGGGRRVLRKDIDQKYLDKMILFLRNSYYWPCLMKFTDSLESCCDMSQFWFREFYLEMAMGKRIQFPIEMSIPWILTDYVLTSQDPSLIECVIYQLDLYNDAASYSLKRFRKRHLYDELEAEVNLCFDQFIYKISDAVFTHYKQLAASMILDKGFKADCARMMQITLRTPPATRFEALLKQRHFQLLGRSIDLNRLVSQRINVAIANSLDTAISKFEAEGLWYVVALDQLIETNRLCHRLLSAHLHSLNDFNDMLIEANHQVYTANGRIALHIYVELSGDILPNFYYNVFTQRFVRGRLRYRNEPEREKFKPVPAVYEFGSKSLNAAFSNISAMHKNYIGVLHFSVMAKLLGYQGVCAIVEELLSLSKITLDEQVKPHIRYLYGIIPGTCKLPRYDYGAEAILQYYLQPAKKVVDYEPLRKEFAQSLREFGNIIAICFQLEAGMTREDLLDLHSSGPFTNAIPKPPFKTAQDQQQRLQRLEEQASRIQISAKVQILGNQMQATIANEAELLTKERLCCGLNIFERVLSRISEYLGADLIWSHVAESANGVMFVDECAEFHRLWSHIQFALLVIQLNHKTSDTEAPSIEEIFGDSINWAALTIIRVLNQHRRFEVLDFAYHLLRVYRAESRSVQQQNGKNVAVNDGNVTLNTIIERIRRQQAINNHILSILGSHLTSVDKKHDVESAKEYVPPVHPRFDAFKDLKPLLDSEPNKNLGSDLSQPLNHDLSYDGPITPR
ncbi:Cytoplasmic FMR1-interacting protein [Aphelenchoides besseyi]|nr:Cytoplasmic FMR1-interacting protein [Aphelenchoides besseyi]